MSRAEKAIAQYNAGLLAGKTPRIDGRYKPLEIGLKAGKVVQVIPILKADGKRSGGYETIPIFD